MVVSSDNLTPTLNALCNNLAPIGLTVNTAKCQIYPHSATAVINKANEIASGISNELSEEGVQYLESEVSKLINIPFRLKK